MKTLKKGKVVLGNEDLSRFVTDVRDSEETKHLLKEKKKQLETFRLQDRPFACEKMQLENLEADIKDLEIQYPRIDLSFLSHSKKIRIGLTTLRVPVFTMHGLYNNVFRVEVEASYDHLQALFLLKEDSKKSKSAPNFIINHYLKAFHMYAVKRSVSGKDVIISNLSYITNMLYDGKKICFYREFNGLVPASTRQKIKYFKKTNPFGTEVYIISEAKKHDWDIRIEKTERPSPRSVTKDPLVVGIIPSGAAYLIDHFNTTTFEKYVAKEFTS
jgi:hypothetical protein